MNAAEAGKLVGLMALADNRTSDEEVIAFWLRMVGDLPYNDCAAAVEAHYRDSTERIQPGHVRQRVKAMRRDRIQRAPEPAPAPELTDHPGRYRAALAAGIQRIADGRDVRKAIGGPLPGEPPPAWQEAREAMRPEAPSVDPQQAALEQAQASRAERAAREAAGHQEAS